MRNQKFREKWKFEDFLRHILKELSETDFKKMKVRDYRFIHSLEESQTRGEKKEEEFFRYEE